MEQHYLKKLEQKPMTFFIIPGLIIKIILSKKNQTKSFSINYLNLFKPKFKLIFSSKNFFINSEGFFYSKKAQFWRKGRNLVQKQAISLRLKS